MKRYFSPLPVQLLLAMLWFVAAPMMHAATVIGTDPTATFQQARDDYFCALQGNVDAFKRAELEFGALHKADPTGARIQAYWGSIELLKAAHTFNVFGIHTLTREGLADLDSAVRQEPNNIEVRYIRAATEYHLPFFLHRRAEAEQDFAWIAPQAERAVRQGQLPAALAASALDIYGCILLDQRDRAKAKRAFENARKIAPDSPAGHDAEHRLKPLS